MSMVYTTMAVTVYSVYESDKTSNKAIDANIEFTKNRAKMNRQIALEDMKDVDRNVADKMNQISFEYEKARNRNIAVQAMDDSTGSSKKKVLFANRIKENKDIYNTGQQGSTNKIKIARENLGKEIDTMENIRQLNSKKKSDLEILTDAAKAGLNGYNLGMDINSLGSKIQTSNTDDNIINSKQRIEGVA